MGDVVIELTEFARRRPFDDRLAPRGVGVVLEAEHLCMSLRGVRAAGARTVTSALRGQLRDDPDARREFLERTAAARVA